MNSLSTMTGIVLMCILHSCITPGNIQSGRTLGKGNTELQLRGSILFEVSELDNERIYIPMGGIEWQIGLKNNLDLGISLDNVLVPGVHLKYQFIGDSQSNFAMACGIRTGLGVDPILDYNELGG